MYIRAQGVLHSLLWGSDRYITHTCRKQKNISEIQSYQSEQISLVPPKYSYGAEQISVEAEDAYFYGCLLLFVVCPFHS